VNQNSIQIKTEARVLFVDMNSFFARCEQQVIFGCATARLVYVFIPANMVV